MSLCRIAKEALDAPLPKGWEQGETEDGVVYYYNVNLNESVWDHPLDDHYRELFRKEKAKKERNHGKQGGGNAQAVTPAASEQEKKDETSEPVQGEKTKKWFMGAFGTDDHLGLDDFDDEQDGDGSLSSSAVGGYLPSALGGSSPNAKAKESKAIRASEGAQGNDDDEARGGDQVSLEKKKLSAKPKDDSYFDSDEDESFSMGKHRHQFQLTRSQRRVQEASRDSPPLRQNSQVREEVLAALVLRVSRQVLQLNSRQRIESKMFPRREEDSSALQVRAQIHLRHHRRNDWPLLTMSTSIVRKRMDLVLVSIRPVARFHHSDISQGVSLACPRRHQTRQGSPAFLSPRHMM